MIYIYLVVAIFIAFVVFEILTDRKKISFTIEDGAYIPEKAHDTDAGFDIRTPVDAVVPARGSVFIDSGVRVDLPKNSVGMLKSKSGLNCKYGIVSEGVIDEGYTGTIGVKLFNHSNEEYRFLKGDKITQLVAMPIIPFKSGKKGKRGDNGFGSSGK